MHLVCKKAQEKCFGFTINRIMNYNKIANKIRKNILEIIYNSASGHIGGSLSCVDILVALYFGDILKINKKNLTTPNRNRFIMSKGHATAAIYSTLYNSGIISKKILDTYGKNNSYLATHTSSKVPGIEFDTGSLGHGLGIACGLAYSSKLKKLNNQIYCLISDGELFEGSIWEAIIFASNLKLNNLTIIIDNNKQIVMDKLSDKLKFDFLFKKMDSFNFNCFEVDGHNIDSLLKVLKKSKIKRNRTNVIICNTIKGKGISFMEGNLKWHHSIPNQEEFMIAKNELI